MAALDLEIYHSRAVLEMSLCHRVADEFFSGSIFKVTSINSRTTRYLAFSSQLIGYEAEAVRRLYVKIALWRP